MATQKEIGDHLDLSDRQIRTLVSEGVLPSNGKPGQLDLDECRIAYIRHLRSFANGTNQPSPNEDPPEEGSLDYERYRLTKAQADNMELKNEIARGKTAPVEILQTVLAKVAGEAAGEIDSIPLNVKRKHPQLDGQVIEDIKRHCVKAQNAVSRVDDALDDVLNDYLANLDSA